LFCQDILILKCKIAKSALRRKITRLGAWGDSKKALFD